MVKIELLNCENVERHLFRLKGMRSIYLELILSKVFPKIICLNSVLKVENSSPVRALNF